MLFHFTVWRLLTPRYMPPEDRFMKRRRLPHRTRIYAEVEEHDHRASPIPANMKRMFPTAGAIHLVGREIE